MKNPNHKGNASPEQLRDYAFYRYKEEMKGNKKILNSKKEDYTEHEEYREPLSVENHIQLTIELSTGGDADGYILTYTKDGANIKGVYYWEDWGCYEEVALTYEDIKQIEELYLWGDPASFLSNN